MNIKIILFYCLITIFLKIEGRKPEYVRKITKIFKCVLPLDKYDPDDNLTINVELMQKSKFQAIVGNLTVSKTTLPVTFNLIQYKMFNVSDLTKLDTILNVTGLSCKNPLICAFFKTTSLKFDEQCRMLAGIYNFKQMNLRQINDANSIRSTSGNHMFEFEIKTRKGVLLCYKAIVSTSLNNSKHNSRNQQK